MELTVRLFGPAQEIAGTARATLVVEDEPTVASLLAALCAAHPDLEALLARSRVAVNHAYVDASRALTPDDEIAIVPPVGGG